MITTAVNVGSTPISFWTIEKFGRRMLLISGAIGMLVCEFVIAIVGTVDEGSKAAGIFLIVFTCFYIFFFASTWGPAAWVVIGEIFPLPIRAKGVALSTASNVSSVDVYNIQRRNANLNSGSGTSSSVSLLPTWSMRAMEISRQRFSSSGVLRALPALFLPIS